MPKKIDLTGQSFGRLVVLEESPVKVRNKVSWICRCDCGNTTKPIPGGALKSGNTKSCGCLHKDELRKRMTKHGMKGTRLYRIWREMLTRCNNQNRPEYKYYGGKGITVCNEWARDFTCFCKWAVANGYKDDLTIDRINNSKGYSPENCRWATMKEQCQNKKQGVNPYRNQRTGRYTTKSEWEAGQALKERENQNG